MYNVKEIPRHERDLLFDIGFKIAKTHGKNYDPLVGRNAINAILNKYPTYRVLINESFKSTKDFVKIIMMLSQHTKPSNLSGKWLENMLQTIANGIKAGLNFVKFIINKIAVADLNAKLQRAAISGIASSVLTNSIVFGIVAMFIVFALMMFITKAVDKLDKFKSNIKNTINWFKSRTQVSRLEKPEGLVIVPPSPQKPQVNVSIVNTAAITNVKESITFTAVAGVIFILALKAAFAHEIIEEGREKIHLWLGSFIPTATLLSFITLVYTIGLHSTAALAV